jgi:hypothetical protein
MVLVRKIDGCVGLEVAKEAIQNERIDEGIDAAKDNNSGKRDL